MKLPISALSELQFSVEPDDAGWWVNFHGPLEQLEGLSVNIHCEALAGNALPESIAVSKTNFHQGSQVLISRDDLTASTGVEVDQYAHPIFTIPVNDSQLRLAARQIPMTAAANFRDYGGYLTTEGRQVVWGKLFRTGHMGEMSERDKAAMTELGIAAICDFRRLEEAEKQPSQLPRGMEPTSIAISPGSSIDLFSATMTEGIDEPTIDQFMQEINADLAINHTHSYRQMFDEILSSPDGASIIHCSAGKDRTGFGGLLVLGALAVPRRTIIDDYLLTNRFVNIDREIARWTKNYSDADWSNLDADSDAQTPGNEGNSSSGGFNRDALAIILGVKASYLQAAYDVIDQQYGGLEAYLAGEIGLTAIERQQLKDQLLYPV